MQQVPTVDVRRYTQLWERHIDRLVFYATTLLRDRSAAEDVVQGVFTRLLSGAALPDEPTEAAYLFRAVRNAAANEMRSRMRAEKAFRSLFVFSAPDPLQAAELMEFSRQIESALDLLADEEREAVALKIWGEISFSQAADVIGVSEKTFEHRYYSGLDALKNRLGVPHDGV